jgi:hypothetical protein
MNQTDFPTLTVFIEAFGLQSSRVLSHLQDQVLSDVKAEIISSKVNKFNDFKEWIYQKVSKNVKSCTLCAPGFDI